MAFPDTDSGAADMMLGEADVPASSRRGLVRLPSLLVAACFATAVAAQVGNTADPAETEDGIPVADSMTTAKCGACHTPDAKGNLARISWLRTTPEGWSQAIKRMVKLNGLQITPEESRHV